MNYIGKPVVVDASRETIYGPFNTWMDAEWFSETYSGGEWAVISLENPNRVRPSELWKNKVSEVEHDLFGNMPPYERL